MMLKQYVQGDHETLNVQLSQTPNHLHFLWLIHIKQEASPFCS